MPLHNEHETLHHWSNKLIWTSDHLTGHNFIMALPAQQHLRTGGLSTCLGRMGKHLQSLEQQGSGTTSHREGQEIHLTARKRDCKTQSLYYKKVLLVDPKPLTDSFIQLTCNVYVVEQIWEEKALPRRWRLANQEVWVLENDWHWG